MGIALRESPFWAGSGPRDVNSLIGGRGGIFSQRAAWPYIIGEFGDR